MRKARKREVSDAKERVIDGIAVGSGGDFVQKKKLKQ